ncbi:hypothetical protein Glove_13g205 [Diversispora epigaea]|uniref:BTB domain-containing protein n=1 Tax=Diversispora epigaea TaxID=1348612 RepID=A0A397JRS8_9GLOM|nr:hypothetical protein Glove_13g205 [Diversispora epigaea]
MSSKFFDKLSQNFMEILNDKDDFNPNENNVKAIIKSSVSAQIFDVILKYIYGGIVNLENVETRFSFDLMLAANKFELDELTNKLETHLIDSKASWLKTYFSLIYRAIFNENNFKKLENYCNDIISKHPSFIFENSDFNSLPESALVSLIKRDDLQMKESKIWDYVIKWGISQNPTLPTNLEEWSKENFLTLKTTLQKCLPLIRYFHISNTELFDKIISYKKILDKQLCKDIIQHLAAPDRPVKSIILPARSFVVIEFPSQAEIPKEPFSTIISEEHAAEISSWIDFVVAKVKGTDDILGGYNPLAWDNTYYNGKWMKTKDSFIFSLKNNTVQNSILGRVKDSKLAICNVSKTLQNYIGPHFTDFYLYSDYSDFTLDNENYCSIKVIFTKNL